MRRKSEVPRVKVSLRVRKNQPPAMLIMLFHTRPMAALGSSSWVMRCQRVKPKMVDDSLSSLGKVRSER